MEYLTKKEVMERYNISEPTLYIWRKQGLPTMRINPFTDAPNAKLVYPEQEVDEWIKTKQNRKGE